MHCRQSLCAHSRQGEAHAPGCTCRPYACAVNPCTHPPRIRSRHRSWPLMLTSCRARTKERVLQGHQSRSSLTAAQQGRQHGQPSCLGVKGVSMARRPVLCKQDPKHTCWACGTFQPKRSGRAKAVICRRRSSSARLGAGAALAPKQAASLGAAADAAAPGASRTDGAIDTRGHAACCSKAWSARAVLGPRGTRLAGAEASAAAFAAVQRAAGRVGACVSASTPCWGCRVRQCAWSHSLRLPNMQHLPLAVFPACCSSPIGHCKQVDPP